MLSPRQIFEDNIQPGPAQEISFTWAKHAVETIRIVCLALDDLVTSRLKERKHQAAAYQRKGTA